jgi:hypothetical protein
MMEALDENSIQGGVKNFATRPCTGPGRQFFACAWRATGHPLGRRWSPRRPEQRGTGVAAHPPTPSPLPPGPRIRLKPVALHRLHGTYQPSARAPGA